MDAATRFRGALSSFMGARRFIRFLAIGAANTAFSYAVYASFLALGLTYGLSSFLAIVLGILLTFKTQSAFVFNNLDNWRIFRFVACWGVIYLANITAITVFLRWGANAYIAGVMTLPFTVVFSYLLQKHVVFLTPKDHG
jgi:putative flippase GtrA